MKWESDLKVAQQWRLLQLMFRHDFQLKVFLRGNHDKNTDIHLIQSQLWKHSTINKIETHELCRRLSNWQNKYFSITSEMAIMLNKYSTPSKRWNPNIFFLKFWHSKGFCSYGGDFGNVSLCLDHIVPEQNLVHPMHFSRNIFWNRNLAAEILGVNKYDGIYKWKCNRFRRTVCLCTELFPLTLQCLLLSFRMKCRSQPFSSWHGEIGCQRYVWGGNQTDNCGLTIWMAYLS